MDRSLPPSGLAAKTLEWFDRWRRDLPWRVKAGETPDPYRVWLSEVLLQQTTTAGAAPYYREFLRRWPDVAALAAAGIDEVMSAFAGLGYYSRARNLHACAKAVAAAGGVFPSDEAALRALPGVGPYTAAAVAAIAFDRPATPVDGNIARIVSRLAGFSTPIASNRRAIDAYAKAMTPARRAGDFAQALMDIGATICRPKAPACLFCPLAQDCRAAASGAPEAYPGKVAKTPRPEKVGAVFFAESPNGAFLARRRPPKGLLGGTMELPGGPWRPGDLAEIGAEDAPFSARWRRLPEPVEHVFTHFTLRLALYRAPAPGPSAPEGMVYVAPDEIDAAGFSGLMRKAALAARAG
jgi:A/G-specific adenine glycosylase